ncbi:transglycosylase SLT domain-containing protein [Candidatus Gottesmanbacteria bacterium]|nr:transglycosylase SLT domain-containing protein [Candidatus Gottesmanbacteria bacterium]
MTQRDDSIPKLTPAQFNTVKKNLLAKQERLINELKTKHIRVYNWLIAHNIDIHNLHKYSKNIAAALALTNQLVATNPQITHAAAVPVPTPPKQEEITNGDASDNSDDNNKKAIKVWKKYGDIIDKVAKKYNIDPQLIFATIMTESEGNPLAYRYESHIGDASYGLGQILYTTAVGLGYSGTPQEMYRPEISIDLIGKYHKNTIDTYGELAPVQMTVVYNTGKLFGWPYPGHLTRFRDWYYNYPKEILSRIAKSS